MSTNLTIDFLYYDMISISFLMIVNDINNLIMLKRLNVKFVVKFLLCMLLGGNFDVLLDFLRCDSIFIIILIQNASNLLFSSIDHIE